MTDAGSNDKVGPYTLAPLPYDYAALEPVIDEATMRLHHDMHHKTYVDNLNKALQQHPEWLGKTIETLMRQLDQIPDDIRQTVRNNGGGHINHEFFWQVLTPGAKAEPTGRLAELINRDFGSLEDFKTKFQDAGAKQFGSGWVFLTVNPSQDDKLAIVTTPNQDSLLQSTETPAILGCDVWEHAYYLKYNNRRPEWLKSWWGAVNWDYAGERLQKATTPN